MAGFNRVIMVGNLTRNPELKQLPSGQTVCRLAIATNRQFKNRQTGSMVQEVCFIDIDVWGVQAESCNQYLEKGRSVLIEGRLKFDTWEDQHGATRSKHSIVADRVVFLSSSGSSMETDADSADVGAGDSGSEVDPALEKELMGKINSIKKRSAKSNQDSDAMDVGFKDEPPFNDELPF